MILYMGGIFLLFSLVGFWYYHKEKQRISSEHKVAMKLYNAQCSRLERLSPVEFICKLPKPQTSSHYELLFKELFFAFLLTLILSSLLSFFLARISLRPMYQAYELMDSFVHAMIHDLNTPIAAAKLNCDTLQKSSLTELQKRKLKRVQKSLERLLALQSQLHSSIENASYKYRDTVFDLCEMLIEFGEFSDLLVIEIPSSCKIDADEMMIHRMIENIVSNAIKYNRDANKIYLSFEENVLIVRDNGMGIKDPSRIFEQYYREDSSMSGLGLGLGIVKMISEYYDLDLKITSKVNEGTTVKVDFSKLLHNQ